MIKRILTIKHGCRAALIFAVAMIAAGVYGQSEKLTPSLRVDLLTSSQVHKAPSIGADGTTVDVFIRYSDASVLDSIREYGVTIGATSQSVATARVPLNALEQVAALAGVVYIDASQPVYYTMDSARIATFVNEVQTGAAPLTKPYMGKGVIVGVIDGGVDFTHPAFKDADGNLRIKRVWIQDNTTGTPPEGFSNGSEFTTPEAILAAETDLKYFSHGTHVMGIAAGSKNITGNPYYGVACDADLVFANFSDTGTTIMNALSWIFRYAGQVHKPCVINMSLGNPIGPHDGTSAMDVMIDELTGPGRIVCGAAGNDGMVDIHISKTFTETDTKMTAGLAYKADTQGYGPVDVWGEAGKPMEVRVVTIDKTTDRIVYQSRNFDATKSYEGTVALQQPFDKSSGSFNIATGISQLNDRPNARIDLRISDFEGKSIAILVTGEAGTTVHAWTNTTYSIFRQQTPSMDIPDRWYTSSEIGGTAKSIITVGSFTTKRYVTDIKGNVIASEYVRGDRSPFSNCGPTVDGRMKPDVLAPGSQIVSALSSFGNFDGTVAQYNTNYNKVYSYGTMTGTSMASPHVTGVVATWLAADSTLTPDGVRSIIARTATHDEFTGQTPNNIYGYGKIDAHAGLSLVIREAGSVGTLTVDNDTRLQAWVEGEDLCVMFLDATPAARLQVVSADGRVLTDSSIPNNGVGEITRFGLSSLPQGILMMRLATPHGVRTLKFVHK